LNSAEGIILGILTGVFKQSRYKYWALRKSNHVKL